MLWLSIENSPLFSGGILYHEGTAFKAWKLISLLHHQQDPEASRSIFLLFYWWPNNLVCDEPRIKSIRIMTKIKWLRAATMIMGLTKIQIKCPWKGDVEMSIAIEIESDDSLISRGNDQERKKDIHQERLLWVEKCV